MSDDEYYYDSPYEDLHDILYDADPAPDLADDLAEHAAYSPVWQDDPAAELQTYFSDWEYYSDDYYDDDPKILKDNPQDGNETSRQPEKRGRKRKLGDLQSSGFMREDERRSLRKCIQGTVWAQSPKLKPRSYKHGDTDKVALKLSDAVMKPAYSSERGFGRGRLRRDESWANDLSLADMGLLNQRKRSSQHDIDFDEDQEEDYDEGDEGILQADTSENEAIEEAGHDGSRSIRSDIPHHVRDDQAVPSGSEKFDTDHVDDASPVPLRKRLRLDNRDQNTHQSTTSVSPTKSSKKREKNSNPSDVKNSDATTDTIETGQVSSQLDPPANIQKQPPATGKKRKNVTDSSEERPTRGRQAKRVALAKLQSTAEPVTESQPQRAVKTTRTRKK